MRRAIPQLRVGDRVRCRWRPGCAGHTVTRIRKDPEWYGGQCVEISPPQCVRVTLTGVSPIELAIVERAP